MNPKATLAFQILKDSAAAAKTPQGRHRIEEMTVYAKGYSEPGYDGDVIVVGNFNEINGPWENNKSKVIDDAPAKVTEALEAADIQIEWEDEWVACDTCGGLVRTSPDSYSWQKSYWTNEDGENTCNNCVLKHPSVYMKAMENQDHKCITLDIDIEDLGYRQVKGDLENGLYDGQADNPKPIADELRRQGITRFVFKLDYAGQFDIGFSVWVHKSQIRKLNKKQFDAAPTHLPGTNSCRSV